MAEARSQDIRARDADRVDACTLLDTARASGELTADEHAGRTAKAMAAKTFGDLDAVLADLQIPRNLVNSPVVRPNRRGPSTRWRVAAAIVVAAALLGAFAGCVARTTAPKPALPDPTTGQGLASFVAAYRDHFGDTKADEVRLYPDYVLIERRQDAPAGRDAQIRYDGSFHAYGDVSRSSDADLFDLSVLDVPKLAPLMAGAPQSLGLPNGRINYVDIVHGPEGDPVVNIYVADGTRTTFMTVTAKGEPTEVHPIG